MKLIKNTIISAFVFLAPLTAMGQTVVTDGNLTVTFSESPLFTSPDTHNLAPGNVSVANIIVENTGTEEETLLFSVANEIDGGLASGLGLLVSYSGSDLYENTFSDLFSNSPITIDTINAGASKNYTLTTTFLKSSDNTYQGADISFDFIVGFSSGSTVTPPQTGGGGGTLTIPTPGGPNIPPGEVAGAATNTEDMPKVLGVADLLNNLIRRFLPEQEQEVINSDTTTTRSDIKEKVDVKDQNQYQESPAINVADRENNNDCTFWWLFILGVMLLIGGLLNHYFRPTNEFMSTGTFTSILFSASFVVLVWVAWIIGILPGTWWVFALAWFVYFGYEHLYVFETKTIWNKLLYYGYYIVTGIIFAASAWLWDIPCQWWPFLGVSVFATILSVREYLSNKV